MWGVYKKEATCDCLSVPIPALTPTTMDFEAAWCPVCSRLIEPKRYTVPVAPPQPRTPAPPPTSPQSSRTFQHLLSTSCLISHPISFKEGCRCTQAQGHRSHSRRTCPGYWSYETQRHYQALRFHFFQVPARCPECYQTYQVSNHHRSKSSSSLLFGRMQAAGR